MSASSSLSVSGTRHLRREVDRFTEGNNDFSFLDFEDSVESEDFDEAPDLLLRKELNDILCEEVLAERPRGMLGLFEGFRGW